MIDVKKLVILTALVSIFSISAIAATYCYGYDYSRGSNNNSSKNFEKIYEVY